MPFNTQKHRKKGSLSKALKSRENTPKIRTTPKAPKAPLSDDPVISKHLNRLDGKFRGRAPLGAILSCQKAIKTLAQKVSMAEGVPAPAIVAHIGPKYSDLTLRKALSIGYRLGFFDRPVRNRYLPST